MIRNVEVEERFGTSDHCIIKFEIVLQNEEKTWKTKYRDYRKADFTSIIEELKEAEWGNGAESQCVEDKWELLKSKINDAVEKHVPMKERVVGRPPKPMWWNKKIQNLRRNRQRWWKKHKESGADEDKERYRVLQRKVKEETTKAKCVLEERLSENIKTDRKGFNKYARSKMKVKESVGPIEDSAGNILKDAGKMVLIKPISTLMT